MSKAEHLLALMRLQHDLEDGVARLEADLDLLLDPVGGARLLARRRAELDFVRAARLAVQPRAEGDEDPRYTLTLADASARLGIPRGLLARLISETPAAAWPCVDTSTGGPRRHLRFDAAQLDRWAKEKPWQASASIPRAGSSAGESRASTSPTPASSVPGSARDPRPRPRSTARLRVVPSAPESGGFPRTGDPDLDALR